jgi:sugar phosphate isomerase/epimerase
MLVDTLDGYERLVADLGGRPLWLTLDIGHCVCLEPEPVADCIRRSAPRLVNVQVDDMRRGVHEHLELGSGEVDLPAALLALAQVGYTGLTSVELPRHSHAAPEVARTSLARLRAAESEGHRPVVGAHAGVSR